MATKTPVRIEETSAALSPEHVGATLLWTGADDAGMMFMPVMTAVIQKNVSRESKRTNISPLCTITCTLHKVMKRNQPLWTLTFIGLTSLHYFLSCRFSFGCATLVSGEGWRLFRIKFDRKKRWTTWIVRLSGSFLRRNGFSVRDGAQNLNAEEEVDLWLLPFFKDETFRVVAQRGLYNGSSTYEDVTKCWLEWIGMAISIPTLQQTQIPGAWGVLNFVI